MSSRLSIPFVVMILTSLLVGQFAPVQAMPDLATSCIYRVKSDAAGKGDGSTWLDAYTTLQPAINAAAAMAVTLGTTCEVWVSRGTYSPGPLASDSFVMKNKVAIYGHFAGDETERSQRRFTNSGSMLPDPDTILSGGGVNYHVVKNTLLDHTAVLDHVTISGGHANGGSVVDQNGAGMYNDDSHPTLSNLIFSGNTADNYGGGMYNNYSRPELMGVLFASNSAFNGGGMFNTNSSAPYILDATFSRNMAQNGGGIYSNGGFTNIANSIFSGNTAQLMGGAIYSSSGTFFLGTSTVAGNTSPYGSVVLGANSDLGGIYNSIVWGNTGQLSSTSIIRNSLVEGCWLDGQWRDLCGTDSGGNLEADPHFIDGDGPDNIYGTGDDNFRLQSSSPAINKGDEYYVAGDWFDLDHDNLPNDMLPYDLDGSPRVSGGQVDMGPYEIQPGIVEGDGPLTFTILEDQALTPVQLHLYPPTGTPAWTIASAATQGTALVSSGGLVSYTPAFNANGSDTFTVQVIDGELTDTLIFNLMITPVNDAPSFQASSEVAVNEDSGPYAAAWANQIMPGPADEQEGGAHAQTLTGFTVTVPSATAGLFKTPPAVDVSTGILTFEPAANANGTVIVQVALQDSSDTSNGGVNSVSQLLTITIHPVNDAPVFTQGGNIAVKVNSGAYSAAWATGIVMGPADEQPGGAHAQTAGFIIDSNTNPGLFKVQPSLDANGILSFTPAKDATGSAVITVYLKDSGGTTSGVDASGKVTFTIQVAPEVIFIPCVMQGG